MPSLFDVLSFGRRAAARLLLCLLLCLLGGFGAFGIASDSAHADALETMVKRLVVKNELPGAVLLVTGPRGRRLITVGVADRASKAPVTTDTRFYVASITKSLVAVMVMQQIDEGLYRLDSPVAPLVEHIPGIGRLANIHQATVRNLLDHSSGMPDYLDDPFDAAVAKRPDHVWTETEALAFAYDQPANAPVGRKYEYTNTNFVLLGQIVAHADGGTLAESLARRIFRPAGMTASGFGAAAGEPNLAHGYSADDGGRLKDVSKASWFAPFGDGALVTTAVDLERFVFAAFRDGTILSPRGLEQMSTPSPREETYGLGLSLYSDERGHCLYHNGSVYGFNAEYAYYVEQGTSIVFMTNGDGDPDGSVADDAVDKAAKIVFGGGGMAWESRSGTPSASPAPASSPATPQPPKLPVVDTPRSKACVAYMNDEYDGGEKPSPIPGRSTAEAWCDCLIREKPDDPGNLARFLRTREGRRLEERCDEYADWE